AASSVHITFAADAAGTLTLKDAADFTGTISGFSSNDQIDLTNINYSIASVSNATYSLGTNITTLVITDGTSTDAIKLVGNYTIDTAWHFSGDGHGGTLLTDSLPGGSADVAQTVTAALTGQDGTADQFTFQSDSQSTLAGSTWLHPRTRAPPIRRRPIQPRRPPAINRLLPRPRSQTRVPRATSQRPRSRQPPIPPAPARKPTRRPRRRWQRPQQPAPVATRSCSRPANFHPDTDVIEIDHTVFADFQALLAATHDDGNGNAVIAANPNDTITVKNVTVAQLIQHQSDFHFT